MNILSANIRSDAELHDFAHSLVLRGPRVYDLALDLYALTLAADAPTVHVPFDVEILPADDADQVEALIREASEPHLEAIEGQERDHEARRRWLDRHAVD